MGTATIIEMRARPIQSAHLCFEVGGILDSLNVQLGSPVSYFDFGFFLYNLTLVYAPLAPGDDSRLAYDSGGISTDPGVVASTVATLRAPSVAATLDKAIRVRQNMYYAKYAPATALAITSMMYNLYGPGAGAKFDLLQQLGTIANNQTNALLAAYTADAARNPAGPRDGVVKRTWSHIVSSGSHNEEEITATNIVGELPPLPPEGAPFSGAGFGEPTTDTEWQGTTGERQWIENQDYGYRTPYFESQAQGLRSTISLADQQFAAFVDAQKMPEIAQIFENDGESMDLDVKRLQIAFLNTILLTPINGVVTGIYKNPGEAVRAGETVVRVEDNSTIFLLATVVCRGPIVVAPPGVPPPPNSSVMVQTKLFDNPSLPQTLPGTIVAARGHNADDTWELVVQCNNLDASGNAILPLGYHFDYDDTVLTIF